MTENHFYLENNQSPIARKAGVNFHTILFVSLTLELFGLTFLVFKLLFVPLFRLIERQILLRTRVKPMLQPDREDVTSVSGESTLTN